MHGHFNTSHTHERHLQTLWIQLAGILQFFHFYILNFSTFIDENITIIREKKWLVKISYFTQYKKIPNFLAFWNTFYKISDFIKLFTFESFKSFHNPNLSKTIKYLRIKYERKGIKKNKNTISRPKSYINHYKGTKKCN